MSKYYPLFVPAKASIKHPKRLRFLSRTPEVFKICICVCVILDRKLLQLTEVQNILVKIVKKARLIQFKRTDDLVDFIKVFDRIIPNEFFGTSKHRKIFYRIIERVLTRSKYECMYVNWFVVGYDYTKVPWLSQEQKLDRNNSMYCIMRVSKL